MPLSPFGSAGCSGTFGGSHDHDYKEYSALRGFGSWTSVGYEQSSYQYDSAPASVGLSRSASSSASKSGSKSGSKSKMKQKTKEQLRKEFIARCCDEVEPQAVETVVKPATGSSACHTMKGEAPFKSKAGRIASPRDADDGLPAIFELPPRWKKDLQDEFSPTRKWSSPSTDDDGADYSVTTLVNEDVLDRSHSSESYPERSRSKTGNENEPVEDKQKSEDYHCLDAFVQWVQDIFLEINLPEPGKLPIRGKTKTRADDPDFIPDGIGAHDNSVNTDNSTLFQQPIRKRARDIRYLYDDHHPLPITGPKLDPDSRPNKRTKAGSFACHFHKLDPEKFSSGRYKSCPRSYPGMNRLKEHQKRVHRPLYYCSKCKELFKSRDMMNIHNEKVQCVNKEDPDFDLYLTTDKQWAALEKKSARRNISDEDHWFELWDAYFEGKARPPSPYCEEIPAVLNGFIMNMVSHTSSVVDDFLTSYQDDSPSQEQREMLERFWPFALRQGLQAHLEKLRSRNSREMAAEQDGERQDVVSETTTLPSVDHLGQHSRTAPQNSVSEQVPAWMHDLHNFLAEPPGIPEMLDSSSLLGHDTEQGFNHTANSFGPLDIPVRDWNIWDMSMFQPEVI